MTKCDIEVNVYLAEVFGKSCNINVDGAHNEFWLFDTKIYDNKYTKVISIARLDIRPNVYEVCTFTSGDSTTDTKLLFGIEEVKEWINANKSFMLA